MRDGSVIDTRHRLAMVTHAEGLLTCNTKTQYPDKWRPNSLLSDQHQTAREQYDELAWVALAHCAHRATLTKSLPLSEFSLRGGIGCNWLWTKFPIIAFSVRRITLGHTNTCHVSMHTKTHSYKIAEKSNRYSTYQRVLQLGPNLFSNVRITQEVKNRLINLKKFIWTRVISFEWIFFISKKIGLTIYKAKKYRHLFYTYECL